MQTKPEKQNKPQIHLYFVSSKLYLLKVGMTFSMKIINTLLGIYLLLGHTGTEIMPFKIKFPFETLQKCKGSLR